MEIGHFIVEKRPKLAIFAVFLAKNGHNSEKNENIKKMVVAALGTCLGIILTKFQQFSMLFGRSLAKNVKF